MSKRLRFLRFARSHFLVFSLVFWMTFILYVVWKVVREFVNKPIDRHADDFTARYWDKKVRLMLFQFYGILLVVAMVGHYIVWFSGFRDQNLLMYGIQLIALITGPLQMLWAVHIVRHASWHFQAH